MHVEANELSLDRRREQLAAQYVLKIKTDHKNPAYDCLFDTEYAHRYENTNNIRPLGIRMELFFETLEEEMKVDLSSLHPSKVPPFPPWHYFPPAIYLPADDQVTYGDRWRQPECRHGGTRRTVR